MKLNLVKCENHGDATKEYVFLKVVEDCNLASYAIYDATYTSDGKLSNRMRHFYRFPDYQVKRGEFVSLRTGKGKNGPVLNQTKQTVHRFYWNVDSAVWNDARDAAVLIEIAGTEAIKAH